MKKLGYLFSLFVVVLLFAGCQPTVSYSNFCTHCGAGYMSQDEADHCSVAVGCPYGYKSIPVEYYDWRDNPLSETPELRKEMENIYENYTVIYDAANDYAKATNVYFTKEGYLMIGATKETIKRLELCDTQLYAVTDNHSDYCAEIPQPK